MKFAIVVGVLAATALLSAPVAVAAPTGSSSAADTVRSLEAEGYDVQINGAAGRGLSECTVTGIHYGSTVYVDIACPSTS